METKFLNFIVKNNLLDNSKSLLLGVSGGPDSLTMLFLFNKLKKKLGVEIAAAHLDHGFRKESKSEAEFVKRFAAKLEIDFYCRALNLPQIIKSKKTSAEAESRYQRFKFFKEVMLKNNFDLLSLAHHNDDQAETVLLNLFRGSGLNGLVGIEAKSSYQDIKIIHPLLEFSKKEILDYSKAQQLKPRFDSSNQENIYSRNIIRNKIFPIVESKINENVKEVIARNSKLVKSENEFLRKLALQKYKELTLLESKNEIIINFKQFKKIDQVLQRRIYRYIYAQLNDNLDDLYLEHIFEIEKLISDQQTGRGIDIAAGIRVEISYEKLIFSKKDFSKQIITEKKEININGKTQLNNNLFIESKVISNKNFSFKADPYQAAFDYKKLKLPLYVRTRRAGDKFIPLGMDGHKKVKDILIDEKVPRFEREKVLLITNFEDEIIWLTAYRLADDFKVTEKTKKILILKVKKQEG